MDRIADLSVAPRHGSASLRLAGANGNSKTSGAAFRQQPTLM
jgi:hypothetical protein